MRVLATILINAGILWILAFLLPFQETTGEGIRVAGDTWTVYLVGGFLLGVLNTFVRPVLKLIGLPFTLLTFGLFIFVINAIVLFLFQSIFTAMNLSGTEYSIIGTVYFLFAVVIFTFLNTLASMFL